MRNRRGPNTLPRKIPLKTDLGEEKEHPSFTVWVLPESQVESQARSFPEKTQDIVEMYFIQTTYYITCSNKNSFVNFDKTIKFNSFISIVAINTGIGVSICDFVIHELIKSSRFQIYIYAMSRALTFPNSYSYQQQFPNLHNSTTMLKKKNYIVT